MAVWLKIVNQTVPEALRRLGYSGEDSKAIIDYIDKNDTIEDAPGVKDEHLEGVMHFVNLVYVP